jgi:hypothetical protein
MITRNNQISVTSAKYFGQTKNFQNIIFRLMVKMKAHFSPKAYGNAIKQAARF